MIFASMVSNSAALGQTGAANRMSCLAVKFYLSTTFLAAAEGIVLFNLFRFAFDPLASPGGSSASTTATPSSEKLTIMDTFLQFGRDLVPDNICKAMLETQLLGVITFAIFLGATLSAHPRGASVIELFSTIFDALVMMIRQVIIITPLGVFSLVAGSIAQSHDLASAMGNIGKLFLVVVLGQACHVFGAYSSIYAVFTRKNPFRYLAGMPKLWITAFGTSSSAATLSTTIKTCQELGVSKRVANFVLPIGCTVNMDGSALERPIVILWIAYVANQPVPFANQLVVAFMAALMSIGASPIPSAGVSTLLLMVEAAQVPITPQVEMLVGFCLAIEWLFDSIRTAVNVTGDAVGVAVVDALVGGSKDDDGEDDDSARKSSSEERQEEEEDAQAAAAASSATTSAVSV